jgi:nicotinamide riboside kinase
MNIDFESMLDQDISHQKIPLKIVLFGPESTGKSTLAKKLAKIFDTVWNPEFLRGYITDKKKQLTDQEKQKQVLIKEEEVLNIVTGQLKSEIEILKTEKPLVFLDTCLYTNLVYADYYFNSIPQALSKAVAQQEYDLLLLCETDIPWVPDEQRDGIEVQKDLFLKMKNYLETNKLPYELLNGINQNRTNNAVKSILDHFPHLQTDSIFN